MVLAAGGELVIYTPYKMEVYCVTLMVTKERTERVDIGRIFIA
jgi:hypothetical protein